MDRSILTKNTGLKIGSLTVALLLWFHIATEKDTYERIFEIPLQVEGIAEGYVIADEIPETCAVRFRGNGKRLLTLPWRDLSLVVDASEVRSSDVLPLGVENVTYPDALDLEVVAVLSPQVLRLNLDRLEQVRLPVVTPIEVELASGYTLVGEVAAVPDSVTLIGPARALAALTYVLTDTLRPPRRARESIDVEVPVLVPDIYNLTMFPTTVRVVHDVQVLGERLFEDVQITFIGTSRPERYLAEPRSAAVTVQGGIGLIEALVMDDIRLVLDMRMIQPDGLTLVEPRVELPTGITLKIMEPALFRVTEF
ncbi:YbbR-like domain-containing protein [Gemmatimonadota bacterium]